MTKLLQWLLFLTVFSSIWLAFFLPIEPLADVGSTLKSCVFWSPLILFLAFGFISVAIIFYRVATFNDCEEAAIELQHQIKEAQADLRAKGIKL